MAKGSSTPPLTTETLTVRGGEKVIVTDTGQEQKVETRADVEKALREATVKEVLKVGNSVEGE